MLKAILSFKIKTNYVTVTFNSTAVDFLEKVPNAVTYSSIITLDTGISFSRCPGGTLLFIPLKSRPFYS